MKHGSIIVLTYALAAAACSNNKSAEYPPQPENPNHGTADAFDPALQSPTAPGAATGKGSATGVPSTDSNNGNWNNGNWNNSATTSSPATPSYPPPNSGIPQADGVNSSSAAGTSTSGVHATDTIGTGSQTTGGSGSSTSSSSSSPSTSDTGTSTSDRSPTAAGADTKDADNTKKNQRDRNNATRTPPDQGGSEADRKLTQRIRQAIVGDKSLSFEAKNVKVITVDGKVTLRGSVKTDEERTAIEAAAKNAAGSASVDNQIEVKNKK